MPVEIRELVIKATVTDATAGGAATPSAGNSGTAAEEIIKTCVEKVMEILKEKNER